MMEECDCPGVTLSVKRDSRYVTTQLDTLKVYFELKNELDGKRSNQFNLLWSEKDL